MSKIPKYISPAMTVPRKEIAHANEMLSSIAKERQKAKELEAKTAEANKPKKNQTTQNDTYQPPVSTKQNQVPASHTTQAVPEPKISPMQQQKQSYSGDLVGVLLGLASIGAGTLGATNKIPLPKVVNIVGIVIGSLIVLLMIADIISKKNIENNSTISLKTDTPRRLI